MVNKRTVNGAAVQCNTVLARSAGTRYL